jgi:hypothetical protein
MGRGFRRASMGRYEAFDDLLPGDVVRWNGKLRKVRKVSRYPDDRVRTLTFAKLRKSGYRHPETHYWRPEVRKAFGGVIARNASLCTTPIECAMQKQIESERPIPGYELSVTQSDTVGVIY